MYISSTERAPWVLLAVLAGGGIVSACLARSRKEYSRRSVAIALGLVVFVAAANVALALADWPVWSGIDSSLVGAREIVDSGYRTGRFTLLLADVRGWSRPEQPRRCAFARPAVSGRRGRPGSPAAGLRSRINGP
jgi:hypothetical protein